MSLPYGGLLLFYFTVGGTVRSFRNRQWPWFICMVLNPDVETLSLSERSDQLVKRFILWLFTSGSLANKFAAL